jgi:hypothetical protein
VKYANDASCFSNINESCCKKTALNKNLQPLAHISIPSHISPHLLHVFRIDIRTALQQQLAHFEMTVQCSPVQGCVLAVG